MSVTKLDPKPLTIIENYVPKDNPSTSSSTSSTSSSLSSLSVKKSSWICEKIQQFKCYVVNLIRRFFPCFFPEKPFTPVNVEETKVQWVENDGSKHEITNKTIQKG